MSDGATNGKTDGRTSDQTAVSVTEGHGPGTGPLLTTRQGQPVYDNQNNRYGRRVAEGLGIRAEEVPPVPAAIAHGA